MFRTLTAKHESFQIHYQEGCRLEGMLYGIVYILMHLIQYSDATSRWWFSTGPAC